MSLQFGVKICTYTQTMYNVFDNTSEIHYCTYQNVECDLVYVFDYCDIIIFVEVDIGWNLYKDR